jgi:hypothetical protein
MIVSMVGDTDSTTTTKLVPASQLSDRELVKRAELVFTEYNSEGNPPGKEGGPSIKRLLHLFNGTRKSPEKIRRYSVGTWKHSADNKPTKQMNSADIKPTKPKEVSFPSLELEASVSKWGDKQVCSVYHHGHNRRPIKGVSTSESARSARPLHFRNERDRYVCRCFNNTKVDSNHRRWRR